jgi:uncharacterized protein YggE
MRKVTHWSVLLFALVGLCSIAGAQCNQNCPERPTISVAGTGQVTADADVAVIHVGFKLFAPDAKSAYDSALDTSNAVMQALTASGIPKAAIESSSQVLQHTQPYDMQPFPMKDEERQRRQFTVMQSWTIRVAPDQASSTLNAAVNAGANESGWIQWIVNNPSDLQAQAAAKAVVNARMIADQIAEKSNVHIGKLVSVSQSQGLAPYGASGSGFASVGAMSAVFTAGPMQPGGQQLAINSRHVEFTVTVCAVYAIE